MEQQTPHEHVEHTGQHTNGAAQPHAAEQESSAPAAAPRKRQFTRFVFFKVAPEWRRLPAEEREQQKREFAQVVEHLREQMMVESYSTMGTRGDCDFLLWMASPEIDMLQEAATRLFSTVFGQHLSVTYSYLAMTKRSIYIESHVHPGQEGMRLQLRPTKAKYLFVYPFVKQRRWYELSKAVRQAMMDEHIEIGHRFPTVRLNTTYSFGLDDQEFVVAFETNVPEDFLQLVMDLRESQASAYTERDTPIFTCQRMGITAALEALGGVPARVALGSFS
ncbi:MAG TPA: chlorite dismutase family protein [Ktedonobacterales bacterium]|jgi:chlorite dismutase